MSENESRGVSPQRVAEDLIAEEAYAEGIREALERAIKLSSDRIARLKQKLARLALPGKIRKLAAGAYVPGQQYQTRLIEIHDNGTVFVTTMERVVDLDWPREAPGITPAAALAADKAFAACLDASARDAIAAARAASDWDPPFEADGEDEEPTPLTDEDILAALRSVEKD